MTCCFCGCLCDDIVIYKNNNAIQKIEKACILGREKILSAYNKRNLFYYIKEGKNRIKTSLDITVKKVAEMLLESEKPILYGWSSTSCEAIKIGIAITELVKGVWDNTTSVCHGPTTIAIAEGGISSATLGQIKNRADTIIYWGSNPLEAHPRHLKRYSYFSDGRFVSKKNRKMITVDVRKTKTAKIADKFIQINPNSDYKFISAISLALKTGDLPNGMEIGLNIDDFNDLIKIIRETKFGVIFFGLGLTMTGYGFANVDAILSLTRELNKFGKWVAMPMRGHYNVNGANIVATYLTGFPYGIDFSSGKAYYNPGETTTSDLIMNNECDLLMSVASDPIGTLPQEVCSKCLDLKLIAMDPFQTTTTEIADVVLPVAISGIESPGTAYRMDGVPLPLKSVLKSPNNLKSDKEILNMILKELKRIQGS